MMKTTSSINNPIARIYRFYRDGFRSMTVGRYLWAMILIKLFILFFIFRMFFFPDLLQRDYDNDADRAKAVRTALTHDRAASTHTAEHNMQP